MNITDRLDEIQTRTDKARGGPWYADGCDVRVAGPDIEDVAYDMDDVDAEFIAHARTDVPALVAALHRVTYYAKHCHYESEPMSPTGVLDFIADALGVDAV